MLAAMRGLHDLGVLSVLGVLIIRAARVTRPTPGWRRLLLGSLCLAVLAAPFWLVLQAAEMAGATTLDDAVAAAPPVLFDTGFGHAMLMRLGLLAVAALPLAIGSSPVLWTSTLAAAVAAAAQISMGHAAAPDSAWQAPAAALHMLAAGAWIGGLLPLACGLGDQPARVARRFSLLGLAAVAVLTITAVLQALPLVGGLPGLLGSAYGRTVLVKTGLFGVLLGLAAFNRFRLSPALAGSEPARAVARLRRSILLEAVVGMATVFTAAWLAGLAPGAHEQPVWPLPWQLSWDALDDADTVTALNPAGMSAIAALLIAAAAVRWRQGRLPLAAAGSLAVVVCVWSAAPQLRAFAVPAYPSSFFESPTGLTKASVAAGAAVYGRECVSCHGPRGFGDGPRATALTMRPTPLTGFHLVERSDGEMFWLVSKGAPLSAASPVMPGFDTVLSEEERWDVIDYVRSLAGAEPGDGPAPSHHQH